MRQKRAFSLVIRMALCFSGGIMICACSLQVGHTHYHVTPVVAGDSIQLAQQKLYVTMPRHAGKSVETAEAAAQTQHALQAALNRASGEKVYAPSAQNLVEELANAQAAGYDYVIWTEILEWSDPPASLQLFSDRGAVTLVVYDAQTSHMLRADHVLCDGSATTVNRIGSYSPADCLKPAFDEWVARHM
jgi:hypothetical protein